MNRRQSSWALVAIGIVFLSLALEAIAGPPVKSITMLAKLRGKGEGVARLEMSDSHRMFQVKVNTVPNQTLIITARRGKYVEKLAWVRTDKSGRGSVVLDTRKDQWVPIMHDKDVIQVSLQGTVILTGEMTSLGSIHIGQ